MNDPKKLQVKQGNFHVVSPQPLFGHGHQAVNGPQVMQGNFHVVPPQPLFGHGNQAAALPKPKDVTITVRVNVGRTIFLKMRPEDTVETLWQKVLKEISGMSCQTNPDLQLFMEQDVDEKSNKNTRFPLLDKGKTLLELGVVDKHYRLWGISKALAKQHAEVSQIRSLAPGFKRSTEFDTMSSAELQEMLPLFPLCVDPMKLGELGLGWPLYFHFMRFLGLLSIIVLICQLPALATYWSTDQVKQKLKTWVMNTDMAHFSMIQPWWGSAGNVGSADNGSGTNSILPALSWFCTSFAILISAQVYSVWQESIKRKVDYSTVDPSDFALLIEDLPKNAVDENEIKEFVKSNACDGQDTEVVKVVIGYNVEAFQELVREIGELQRDPEEKAAYEELMNVFRTRDRLVEKIGSTGSAVVLLRRQEDVREAERKWQIPVWIKWLQELGIDYSDKPRFREGDEDEVTVNITRALNPTDIIWRNVGEYSWQRGLHRSITGFFVAILLVIFCAVVFMLNDITLDRQIKAEVELHVQIQSKEIVCDETSQCQSKRYSHIIGLMIVRLIACAVLSSFILWRATRERNTSRTMGDVSVISYLTVTYVLLYAVVQLLVYEGQSAHWYTSTGLAYVLITYVMTFFLDPIQLLFPPLGNIKNYVLRCLFSVERLAVNFGYTQSNYEEIFMLPEMDISMAYACAVNVFVSVLIFVPVVPWLSLLSAFNLWAQYLAVKYRLLRFARRPYRVGDGLSRFALHYLDLGTAAYSMLAWGHMTPSLVGCPRLILSCWWVVVILACFRSLINLRGWLSNRVFSLCQTWLPSFVGEHQLPENLEDYYQAQFSAFPAPTEKYHKTQPVYVYLETLEKIKALKQTGYVPEYNFQDGSFPTPEQAQPPEAPYSLGSTVLHVAGASMDSETIDKTLQAVMAETRNLMFTPAEEAMGHMKYDVPRMGDDGMRYEALSEESDLETYTILSRKVIPIPILSEQFHPGQQVRIKGLKHANDYNGTVATIISWQEEKKAWMVELFTGLKGSVATQNLRLLYAGESAEPIPSDAESEEDSEASEIE